MLFVWSERCNMWFVNFKLYEESKSTLLASSSSIR